MKPKKAGTPAIMGQIKHKRAIASVFFALVVGLGVFLLPIENWHELQAQQRYSLLAKRVNTTDPNDTLINFAPLRKEVDAYLTKVDGRYSFYFEYLPTGTAIRRGLNNDGEGLVTASLMKLPFVMDLYKAAERGDINLDQEVTIKQEWLNQGYGELYKRGAGTKITLREAARIALTESDNTAMRPILNALNERTNRTDLAIKRLDLPFETESGTAVPLGARAYSSVLKCLYFACYLDKDSSQDLLSLLAEAPAQGRIKAGLPADVRVAHKIGVYGENTQSDCGIVYLPKRQYLLCMMFESSSDKANAHMQALSKTTYDYVRTAE